MMWKVRASGLVDEYSYAVRGGSLERSLVFVRFWGSERVSLS